MAKSYILTFLLCALVALGVQAQSADIVSRLHETKAPEMPDSIPRTLPDSIATPESIEEAVVYETEADSIVGSTYNLDEVVVQADREVRLKDGMAFYPTKDAKKFSTDGINLLARMMIPTLKVGLMDNSVEAVSGANVSYFINGMKATGEEVMAIAPEDVNKVEVLEHPTDAKYMGAEVAVNYVVTRYLWGGYTKAVVSGWAPTFGGLANVQSSFTYKRMTYNAYIGGNYKTSYGSSEETQNLLIDNVPYSISSTGRTLKGHTTSQSGYFSALYRTDNFELKNTISLSHNLSPNSVIVGTMDYFREDQVLLATETRSGRHSNILTPAWNGKLNWLLPSNAALAVDASVSFRNNNSDNRQYQWENGEPVFESVYSVRETGSNSSLDVTFSKTWNNRHSFKVWGMGNYNFYRLAYGGSVGTTSVIAEWLGILAADYTYSWNRGKFMTSVRGNYNESDFSKSYPSTKSILPSGYVFLLVNPGRNQQVTGRVAYNVGTYALGQIDPTPIQSNLLIWTKGNPSIKPISSINSNVSYTWWIPNKLSINATVSNDVDFNTIYRTAIPNPDGQGMTVSYEQGTTWCDTKLSMNVQWLIAQGLIININGNALNLHKSAPVNDNKFRVQGGLQVQWFHRNISLYGSFSTPGHSHGFDGYYRSSLSYGIGAKLSLGHWLLALDISNPFNSEKSRESWGRTPNGLYATSGRSFSKYNSTVVSLGAIYTIRYGKKRTDENQEDIITDTSLMR